MIAHLPGITDEELVRRVLMNLRKPRGATSPYRWCAVALVFGLGIKDSKTLCERFGYDPQEILRP